MVDAPMTRRVSVPNARGLHARPCHAIASTALSFQSELRVQCEGLDVNGKSILELMTLAAPQGAELGLLARGADAPALLDALEALIRGGFGESS